MNEVSFLLMEASARTNATVAQLSEALNQATPAVIEMLEVAADQGIKGRRAGEAIAHLIRSIDRGEIR